jgi:hypothetical protein
VRSEIPQLEVVTAVGDAEVEDYIAQLLFSQGWNIVYRSFDMESLIEFFASRPIELRTVLVYRRDLPEFNIEKMNSLLSPTLTMISLDEIPITAHQVMSHIRSQLRLPLIVNQSKNISQPVSQEKIETILITGTSGAPGRSTLAVNLALDLSLPIYDFDFKSPAINYLIERSELDIKIARLATDKPREYLPEESAILDLGALPPLTEMVNDRRWQAALLNSAFDSATKLLYVCKANGLSLMRLQKFIEDFPVLLKKIPIIYIFNLAGNSREERALERGFLKIVSGESAIVIPHDLRIANPNKSSKSSNRVIGKLSSLVR